MANNYNPDVLNCIANLSNDEVFTPPTLANQVLDMLPQSLFADPATTFLDPFTKSGVFLREIVKRLDRGLATQIPNRQARIDHILHKQVFGIACTELTSYLARRSVYCSKHADGKHCVSPFETEEGNIIYTPLKHTWRNGRCKFCGANQSSFDREDGLEQYAYQFIHTEKPNSIFPNMTFDVIIGNPPYQFNDNGAGASARPLYHLFVQQAIKLSPRYLSMIIPARWFSAGKDVDDFREAMLHDDRIRVLHDYMNAGDCFSGVDIKGGVCYFLWDRDNRGLCNVITHKSNGDTSTSTRGLLEKGSDTFIRDNEMISILHKVKSRKETSMQSIISSRDPFGYDIRQENSLKTVPHKYSLEKSKGEDVEFYYNGWRRKGVGYVNVNTVRDNKDWVEAYKVLIPNSWGAGDASKDRVRPFIIEPHSVCTETYLVVGPFKTRKEAENAVSYIETKFFHALVSTIKISQHATRKVYSNIPIQDFQTRWDDKMLCEKYGLTQGEGEYIDSLIPEL